ncbi:MAG: helix-turn-helix transcriptional regulator [Candidatus Rokubacteria bacterium]|nr:helix-turn-helix transcriptional regulator [Candidatus Rokubacteria bacterium]
MLGDRWTFLIVRDLLPAARRFQDLREMLSGVPPNLLSDRLKRMEQHRLVARQFYSKHPPRAEYALTDKGRELGIVVGALAEWGTRHVYRRASLVHEDCGHSVRVRYVCGHCRRRVRGNSVKLRRR